MKTLYFDCFSGISGDMTLAALTDLGVPEDYLRDELKKLDLKGWSLEFSKVSKNGIVAQNANVIIEAAGEHVHRHYGDIVEIINKSGISQRAKELSLEIFTIIGRAEARIHGAKLEQVHFHEVGALDSIIDIVGTAIGIDYLKPGRILSSRVNDGFGFINCQHGKIPVPVPATVEIFSSRGVKFKQIDIEAELVTPTGAGIIAALAEDFSPLEGFTIEKTGYGAGKKELEIPNVLRLHILKEEGPASEEEKITVIETNIDDQSPELTGFLMEKLLLEGARDVFITPVQMKKNRPGSLLTVLCGKEDREKMTEIIFLNSSTIGLRYREERRLCLKREIITLETEFGPIKAKVSYFGGRKKIQPEYESIKEAAIKKNIPPDTIYRSAVKAIGE